MKRLRTEEVMAIARKHFRSHFDMTKLTDEERSKLTQGYHVEADTAFCNFYIPARRYQDGKILAEIRIDRNNGRILEHKSFEI